jgi:hypothetical protein
MVAADCVDSGRFSTQESLTQLAIGNGVLRFVGKQRLLSELGNAYGPFRGHLLDAFV